MTLKEKERELYRDACFLRTAIIKMDVSKGTQEQKDKKQELFKEKDEVVRRQQFYKKYIREMERIKYEN